MKRAKRLMVLLLCSLMLSGITGCGKAGADTKLVLTTGFKKNEIFRIETMSCTLPEIMVYRTNAQNQYESVYGKEIWETSLNDVTLEESVKETVLAQLAQIKTMNLLAKQYDVSLNEQEKETVAAAAAEYYSTLNETERESMQVTQEVIDHLYEEFVLANKVYKHIIRDINPEISDDEARTITVQHILIKTYTLDGSGSKTEYTESAREDARKRAEEILKLAKQENADFEELALAYSEGEGVTWSFGKGETAENFEEAAFQLETGEISDIIETEYGYHIIKCINTFNREETDANKIKIVEKRKEEVFGQEYDAFVATLTRTLNEDLWKSISFIENEEVNTRDFFDIYNKYFS